MTVRLIYRIDFVKYCFKLIQTTLFPDVPMRILFFFTRIPQAPTRPLPWCLTSKAGSSPAVVRHDPECSHTQARPHTRYQEVATYLTDFMDLSILPAGLLPGDSFLLRRKPSRFFMSLALSDREGKRARGEMDVCVWRRKARMGKVGIWRNNGWKGKKGEKTQGESRLSPNPKSTLNSPMHENHQLSSSVNPIHMKSNQQMPEM